MIDTITEHVSIDTASGTVLIDVPVRVILDDKWMHLEYDDDLGATTTVTFDVTFLDRR